MITKCNECGEVYDDFDHRTICPHPYFDGPSRGEIEAIKRRSIEEAKEMHERMFGKR